MAYDWRKRKIEIDEAKAELAKLARDREKYTQSEYFELQKPYLRMTGTLWLYE